MAETVKLLICGDIIPTEENEQLMCDGKIDELFGDTKEIFDAADFRFCNCEGAFTEGGTPIDKCGPNMRGKPGAALALKKIGIDLVGLANNHSLDFGKEGLVDTFKTLQALHIPYMGAGYDLNDARRPYRFELKGIPLTILDVAEHEFTIASKTRAGANPFDVYDTIEDIEAEKKAGRIVIVVYHGGKEHYRLTSPETRRRLRKMAEHGADFVFAQHTHCVCCAEIWHGCHICYGQGNTLFSHSSSECWKTELLPMISITTDGKKDVTYYPVCQENGRIWQAKGEAADAIMKPFHERSALVGDDDYVEAQWLEFAMSNGKSLLRAAGVLDADYNPHVERGMTILSNYFRCEIHYESVRTYIEERRRLEKGDLLVLGAEKDK